MRKTHGQGSVQKMAQLYDAPRGAVVPIDFCERCCAEIATSELASFESSNTSIKHFGSVLLQFLVGGLKFLGMLAYFFVAIWFFPTSETPQQKRRRLEREANERKREADDYYRWLAWADAADKRTINHKNDQELYEALRKLDDIDAEEKQRYYHDVEEIESELERWKSASPSSRGFELKVEPYTEDVNKYASRKCKDYSEANRLDDLAKDELVYRRCVDEQSRLDAQHREAELKLRRSRNKS